MLVSSIDISAACNVTHEATLKLIISNGITPKKTEKIKTGGRPRKELFITADEASRILACSRSVDSSGIKLLSDKYGFNFGDPVNRKINIRSESLLANAISTVCKFYEKGSVRVVQQHTMSGFNIDIAVITDYGVLCIEHDGTSHKYSSTADRERETSIASHYLSDNDYPSNGWFFRCLEGEEMDCVARVSNFIHSMNFLGGALVSDLDMYGFSSFADIIGVSPILQLTQLAQRGKDK